MKKLFVALGVALATLLSYPLWSQQLTSQSLTGNEVLVCAIGGPGGPSIFCPISQIRNAQGVTTTSAVSGTINLTTLTATLVTTAQVTGAMTLNTPALPWDGEIFELANGSGANNTATVTLTASGSQTVNGGAVATQANQTSTEWRYVLATNTWYRVR
jgi:hypothetical protein